MVTRLIEAAARKFTPKREKIPDRRLLVVIRTADGDLVLQKKQEDHRPRHHYDTEARTLLQTLFPAKPEKYCARAKANNAFHKVFEFKRPSDIALGKRFERDGVEYHPTIFDIAYLGMDMKQVKELARKGEGLKTRTLQPLQGHPFEEKLKRLFPKNS